MCEVQGRIPPQPVVCEIGFNAGHSAMLMLETLRGGRSNVPPRGTQAAMRVRMIGMPRASLPGVPLPARRPDASLYEWDLGQLGHSPHNAELFRRLYEGRFKYIQGDSHKTIKEFVRAAAASNPITCQHCGLLQRLLNTHNQARAHPEFWCDVILIDGIKGVPGRKHDALPGCSHCGTKTHADWAQLRSTCTRPFT